MFNMNAIDNASRRGSKELDDTITRDLTLKSIFDDPIGRFPPPNLSGQLTGFWAWRSEDKNALKPLNRRPFSEHRLIEGNLFIKNGQADFFKSRYYVLYSDGRFVYYKSQKEKPEEAWVSLNNVTLIKMPQSPNDIKEDRFGLRLVRNGHAIELICRSKDQFQKWWDKMKHFCIQQNFTTSFVSLQQLSRSSASKVFLARRLADDKEFAVKTFIKKELVKDKTSKEALVNELNLHRMLDHENITRLIEVYENENFVYVVLEYLSGGDLFSKIKALPDHVYTEKSAAILIKNILEAIEHLHSKGIMHRDLKPENLLLADPSDETKVKIADFGLSAMMGDTLLFKRCGTPGYVAPEVLQDQKYDIKVDVFSIGVIMYILLTGTSPFYGKTYEDVVLKNLRGEVDFDFSKMRITLSPSAVDLLKRLLEIDPRIRITPHEALHHEWILNPPEVSNNVQKPMLTASENMSKYQDGSRFNISKLKELMAEKTATKSPALSAQSPFSRSNSIQNNLQISSFGRGGVNLVEHTSSTKPSYTTVDDDLEVDEGDTGINVKVKMHTLDSFLKFEKDQNSNDMSPVKLVRGISNQKTTAMARNIGRSLLSLEKPASQGENMERAKAGATDKYTELFRKQLPFGVIKEEEEKDL